MKLRVGFFATILLLLVLSTAFTAIIARPKPAALKKAELKHDFGVVRANTLSEYVLSIRNKSNGEIRPISVKSSCGCVQTLIESRKFRRGEPIEATIRLKAPDHSVDLSHLVTIIFDNSELDTVIKVTAKVRPEMHVSVDAINLEYGGDEDVPSSTFIISNYGTRIWKTPSVLSDSEWLLPKIVDKRLKEVDEELLAERWECELSISPLLTPGFHKAFLTISDDLGKLTKRVPVVISQRPEMVAFPGSWYFFNETMSSGVQQSRLVFRDGLSIGSAPRVSVSNELIGQVELELNPIVDEDYCFLLKGICRNGSKNEIVGAVNIEYEVSGTRRSSTIPVIIVP